ncbi:MAG: hypothetical protein ACE5EU_13225, partial [Paracoccaceae bacterium]
MTVRKFVAATAAVVVLSSTGPISAGELAGASAPIGQGTVESYAVIGADGVPAEIGIVFSKGALDGLPPEPNRTSRCFD